ncbi:anti-sigma factor antagonist [Cyanobium gracile]|uniref:Anti-sigma factor antagonist n=1 Tax=Cyanobium gracile (strain ATCC 27147 / PCC 6307) TaxID=292564 RepID=K9PC21_CYAGP|nr:anti-sigma factor antagonist [Cyanobium gracile]AFY30493.1 anti-anti-sigma regulatory factor (antagonist of anti-sigma factor) [Cyanobium gracile PCC 6307]
MTQTASIRSDDVLESDGAIKLRKVILSGRLDMLGMEEIALKLTSLTAIKPLPVILDLRDVSFLASIGIRSIISSARALDQKGGRMVLLLGTNELVKATLESTGIDDVIPMVSDEDQAERDALARGSIDGATPA